MERFCVFCGQKPRNKTKEHIVPQWLIEYTGKKNRIISVGYDAKNKKTRYFAFDKLTFPACDECNNKFSKLENETKNILINILENNQLYNNDINTLLDWFDKVRVGLWLLFYSLNDNFMNIDPNFHIANRIGQYDRMIIISKVKDKVERGINFLGTDTSAFQINPCCFTLRINEYYFFNVSKAFLFSNKMGFPYPIKSEYIDDDSDIVSVFLTSGKKRKVLPLIRKKDFLSGIEIYQPMFKPLLCDPLGELYNNNYVKEHCINVEKGIGKPFIYNKKTDNLEDEFVINTIDAENEFDPLILHKLFIIQTYKYQNELILMDNISLKNLSIQAKLRWNNKKKAALEYNKNIIRRYERMLKY